MRIEHDKLVEYTTRLYDVDFEELARLVRDIVNLHPHANRAVRVEATINYFVGELWKGLKQGLPPKRARAVA